MTEYTKKAKKKITQSQAVAMLWEMGDLSYKLRGIQLDMRDAVYNSTLKTSVYLVARQSGKSFTMCTVGTEYCLKNPNQIVLLLFPKKKDAANVAKTHMRKILEDCPPHLKPDYLVADKTFVFPNGSEMRMAGTDGGSAESVRGSTLNLVLMDEAGFHDYNDFQYIVTSIIIPTLTVTKGKIIMASTPSREPDHAFMVNYVEPFRAEGWLVEYDVNSNPMLEQEDIDEIADNYPLGKEDPDFQREYMLKTNVSSSLMVVPEWVNIEEDIVVEQEMPVYYDAYVSCDPAVTHLTGILYGYYDYLREKLVILDESVLGGPGESSLTTEDIANALMRKEGKYFRNRYTGEQYKPYMRIMDNNLPLLANDLRSQHNLHFIRTEKTQKEDKVNQTRMLLKKGAIEIHPRCKNLIYHIRTAKWDKSRKKFVENKANKSLGIKANHSDLLDALVYLVRNYQPAKNPYPPGYFELSGDNVWGSGEQKVDKNVKQFMHKIMKIDN